MNDFQQPDPDHVLLDCGWKPENAHTHTQVVCGRATCKLLEQGGTQNNATNRRMCLILMLELIRWKRSLLNQ